MKRYAAVVPKTGLILLAFASSVFAQQYCVDGVVDDIVPDTLPPNLFKVGDTVQIMAAVSKAPPCLASPEKGEMSTCTVTQGVTAALKASSRTWTSTRGTLQINQTNDAFSYFIVDADPALAPPAPKIRFSVTLHFAQNLIAEKKIPNALPDLDVSPNAVGSFGTINGGAAHFRVTGICGQTAPQACPIFQQMLSEEEQINKLAASWEQSDDEYQDAVFDMIFLGYGSRYARYALNVPAGDIPTILGSQEQIIAARSQLIARIRTKAKNRGDFARIGISGSFVAGGIHSKENISLFCAPDPSAFTKDFWDSLWMAGYVDYDLYTQTEKELIAYAHKDYFEKLALFASLPIAEVATLSRFVFLAGAEKLFLTNLEVAGVKQLSTKSLPKVLGDLPGPALEDLEEGEIVVASFRGGQYANRLTKTDEVFYRYHGVVSRNGTQVSNRNALKKVVWLTNKRYASEIELRRELAIKESFGVTIDSVSTINVPAGTWISEGEAAAQGEMYPGGGYQAVIENVPNSWILRTEKPW